ncbi:MAG: alpha/beta hydrolase [Xanthobacteraceae bacterium]|jgi:pimeloyl-ACP methyl ester carboxylesterase|nr:alpha/beta hydrolase [Xanthobacteraceae bacterium]
MLERGPRTETFIGSAGNKLGGDLYGKGPRPVLLLHGGGQTRHAFAGTAQELAKAGWSALVLDQRGHGDSEWVKDGSYSSVDFAKDAASVAGELTKRFGKPPVLVGASLGGMAGMLAEGIAFKAGEQPRFSALILVDVTPRFDTGGAAKILGFMGERVRDGFASIEEAADAVAKYLPHRPRPSSTEGLRKNLRQRDNGRWYWHWDPRFFSGPKPVHGDRHRFEAERVEAVRTLRIPALLVRGGSSELVKEENVKEFLALAPHAKFVDVAGARHMVAGDRNDVFSAAIVDFLAGLAE